MDSHDKSSIAVFAPTHIHCEAKTKLLSKTYIEAEEFFNLSEELKGRSVGDFGCGNHGETIEFLLDWKAKEIIAVDLDTTQCQRILKSKNIAYQEKVSFINSSIQDLEEISSNSLDFIWCTGVLHCVQDPALAISEIGRILKPGGQTYIMVTGEDSLVSSILYNGIRSHYRSNKAFNNLMEKEDSDVLEFLHNLLEHSKNTLLEKGGDSDKVTKSITLLEALIDLIDIPFIQTCKDRIQAPKYETVPKKLWDQRFSDAGMKKIKEQKPSGELLTYSNIRNIVAPFYADHESIYSQFLYGEGSAYKVMYRKEF